jgi:hypothetical protein
LPICIPLPIPTTLQVSRCVLPLRNFADARPGKSLRQGNSETNSRVCGDGYAADGILILIPTKKIGVAPSGGYIKARLERLIQGKMPAWFWIPLLNHPGQQWCRHRQVGGTKMLFQNIKGEFSQVAILMSQMSFASLATLENLFDHP